MWVNPQDIQFKITPLAGLQGKVGGDWDIDRRFALDEVVKHRSITQRYREGKPWEETELFRDMYSRRFEQGDNVRGAASFKDLVRQYETRVDGMFNAMRTEGFQLRTQGKWHPLPTFLLGRGGEIFIGNQGNHRLAIAQVLGLDKFAGKVVCWHSLA